MSACPGQPPGILVVDDNEQNRALLEAALEDEGYRVALAASGEAALGCFEAESFDCVLLDVRMPGMSGFEVCRRIRAHPRGADVPIVFLTALRDVDTFDQAIEAGGDDFLTKPLNPAELAVRVSAALELRRLNAENRGYYATVREQRDAVMRLQLQKDQLTAFLVHDLKNPVNALDMHAQLILRDPTLSEKARASTRAIREEARRLTQLITNMLDISKGESSALSVVRRRVDVASLAESLLSEFAVRAQQREIRLESRLELEWFDADPDLLRRLLENLLDNAIRYAPRESVVTLRAWRDGGDVQLRVADGGPGVPEGMRETIFEPFAQVDPGRGPRSSYGLGLAFCKLAVVAHGGAIWLEDGAPGAVFCVRFPDGR